MKNEQHYQGFAKNFAKYKQTKKKRENIYTIPVDYCAQSLVHGVKL